MNSDALAAYDDWHACHPVDEAADAPWHRMVKSRLRPDRDLAGKRILEIGCGRGGWASWLARHAARPAEVVAADFSPVAVEQGRQYAADQKLPGISWQVMNIQEIDSPAAAFDTVFSFETIEHVPDPPRAVAELARVLKPGGRLYLTTPNYLGTLGLYRGYCRVRGKTFDEGGQPICQFTTLPKTRRWVRRGGLRIVEATSTGQYLPFPGRPPIEFRWAEHPRPIMKWFGLHSLVVGEKPGG